MVRRIISGARSVSGADHNIRGPRAGREKLVIADWGPAAELLVFPADEPVGLGAEFHYSGSIWVITGSQRDSRIMVAEPVTH